MVIGFAKWSLRSHSISMPEICFSDIDQMTGDEFEEFLTKFFGQRGFSVKRTGGLGDMGCDLVLSKNGERTIVQAKRWKNWVGVDAVRAVVAAKAYYHADATMVITNSTFTDNAIILGRANGVAMWDRQRLASEFRRSTASISAIPVSIIIIKLHKALLGFIGVIGSMVLSIMNEILDQCIGNKSTSYGGKRSSYR